MYTDFALTSQRPSTQALSKIFSTTSAEKKTSAVFIILTFITLSVSTIAMAGPKEPKLAGNNGNSRGR